MPQPEPKVSVVIPTCRSAESLSGTLCGLAVQCLPPGTFEAVIVLDGPDAGRFQALSARNDPFPVRIVKSTGRGRAAACNTGVHAAVGEVVLLLDDDMLPEPNALAAHQARHAGSDPVAVMGAAPIELAASSTPAARYVGRRFDRHLTKLAATGRVVDVRDVYTGSFSLRRQTYLAVGGFDERFVEYGNEDGEFAGRLTTAGVPIEFAPEAVTRQTYAKSFARLAADNVAKGRTAQQFLARHPDRAAESAVLRRRRASPSRRVVRAVVSRLVATPVGMASASRLTERAAAVTEKVRPATADRIIDVLLDACFWSGVSQPRIGDPIRQPSTVVHYMDGTYAGGVEQMGLTLLSLLDGQRWRPVLLVHESPGQVSTIAAARAAGVRVGVLPPRSGPKGMWTILALARRLRALRPAVVHVHRSWAMSGNAGVVAAVLAGCRVVVTTEHLYLPGTRQRALRVRRVIDRGVHRHVAVSESLGDVLRDRFHIAESRIEVIHNGVPQPLEPAATVVEELRREWRSAAASTVLIPARLDKNKGHSIVLTALRELPDVLVLLAGDGPERESLERLVASLGVAERVRFLGHRNDVPALMTAADVVVLPSKVEGLPLVLLEASALGCPIVASDVNGVGEAVEDRVSGLLTSPDAAALAGAIRTMLNNPHDAEQLGQAARDRFRERFTADRMVSKYERLYEQLLDAGPTGWKQAREEESTNLRKLDWRFLTSRHHFARAAYFSAPADVERALGVLRTVATDVVSGTQAGRGSVDLAVAVDPDTETLQGMVGALRDGGSLVFAGRGPMAESLARCRRVGLGYDARAYVPWYSADHVRAWLPLDDDVACRRVLGRPAVQRISRRWLKAWLSWGRGRVRLWWCRHGAAANLFVVARKPGAEVPDPLEVPLREAWRNMGPPAPGHLSFTLLTGGRESISKAVTLVTQAETLQPGVVVKWPRTVAAGEGLAREADNLRFLARTRDEADLRVPVLLHEHRTDVGPALIETLFEGFPLTRLLTPASHLSVALTAAERLADFTRRTPESGLPTQDAWYRTAVAPVTDRFLDAVSDSVDPRLLAKSRGLLAAMGPVPFCMEHRDLAPWNLLVDARGGWQVTDWESSVAVGLPFADLWYFLTWAALSVEHMYERSLAEVYPRLTDPRTRTGKICAAAAERYATALGIDPRALDPLRTLTWMIHVPSEVRRLERLTTTPLQPEAIRRATFVRLWAHEVRRASEH